MVIFLSLGLRSLLTLLSPALFSLFPVSHHKVLWGKFSSLFLPETAEGGQLKGKSSSSDKRYVILQKRIWKITEEIL